MKKIVLLLMIPFFLQTQKPIENKTGETKNSAAEEKIAVDNPKEQTRQLLESYRQRIFKGESFGSLAIQYSQDPGSAKNGGRYSNVAKGTMVPEFEDAVYRLKPGEISEIFETQYGFHFVQLIDRKGDIYDVRHILLMFPK